MKNKYLAASLLCAVSLGVSVCGNAGSGGLTVAAAEARGEEERPEEADGSKQQAEGQGGNNQGQEAGSGEITSPPGGESDGPDQGGGHAEREPAEAAEGMANLDVDPQGFVCIATEDGEVYWEAGVDTYERLIALKGIDTESSYVKLEVVPDNEEEYIYLYPDQDWKLLIYEETAPKWMDEAIEEAVMAAFEEWKSDVYSIFDYEAFRDMTAADTVEAAPGDGYEPTEEDLAAFREFVILKDSLCTYLKTSVNDTLAAAFGTTMAADMWNYMNDSVGHEAEGLANLGSLIRNMGLSNVGAVQKDFYGAVAGHFFALDSWNYYDGEAVGYPYECAYYLWSHGLCVSEDSNKLWRLHSANGGEIYAEIPDEEVSASKAFACVVTEDGSIYWGTSLDNPNSIREANGIADDAEAVNIQVKPTIDAETAELALPDGNNPEVTKYFPYFDSTAVWTLTVLDAETPDWFDETMEEAVMAACEQWKTEALASFALDDASTVFTGETQKVASYTDEDIELLREWAIAWHNLKDQQMDPTSMIKLSGYQNIGVSLWNQADEYFLSTWRVQHSDCPGAVVSNGYWGRLGITDKNDFISSVNDTLANSVSDAMEALTAKFFAGYEDWEWEGYTGDAQGYPYEAAAELIIRNLVPSTDGSMWYLSSGIDAEIVFEISEEELLAE